MPSVSPLCLSVWLTWIYVFEKWDISGIWKSLHLHRGNSKSTKHGDIRRNIAVDQEEKTGRARDYSRKSVFWKHSSHLPPSIHIKISSPSMEWHFWVLQTALFFSQYIIDKRAIFISSFSSFQIFNANLLDLFGLFWIFSDYFNWVNPSVSDPQKQCCNRLAMLHDASLLVS